MVYFDAIGAGGLLRNYTHTAAVMLRNHGSIHKNLWIGYSCNKELHTCPIVLWNGFLCTTLVYIRSDTLLGISYTNTYDYTNRAIDKKTTLQISVAHISSKPFATN